MEESLGGMFKLIGSMYSIGKSKMKDMLLCKDLWLLVQFGKSKTNKIDAWTRSHLTSWTAPRCIDLGSHASEGSCIHKVLYRHDSIQQLQQSDKSWRHLEEDWVRKQEHRKQSLRLLKIVRLRYQNGSSMVEDLNAFQGLINQTTSLEVPLDEKVLALFLLRSLLDSWETLVETLGNAGPQGKRLSLEMVKSSLLNEEALRNDKESISDHKALVIEGVSYRGRGQ